MQSCDQTKRCSGNSAPQYHLLRSVSHICAIVSGCVSWGIYTHISSQVNKALQNKTFRYWMKPALQALAATPLHLMLKGKPHIKTDPVPTYM